MKKLIAIGVLAMAGLMTLGTAGARTPQAQFRTVQFGPGYQQIGSCNINGVLYPVGQDYRVWGYANGSAWVIGYVNWNYSNVWTFHGNNGTVSQVQCG